MRAPERQKFMVQQLKKLHIDFDLFQAIDGRSAKFITRLEGVPRIKYSNSWDRQPRELLNTEIACALSHQAVYKLIVKEKIPYALILEDDVVLTKKLALFLEYFPKFILVHTDIELINLFSDSPGKIILPKIFPHHFLFQFTRMPNRSSAYIITNSGARKMIENFLPIRMPADDLLGRFEITSINGLGLYPHIVALAKLQSTINDASELKFGLSRSDLYNKIFKIRGIKFNSKAKFLNSSLH
jgi:glycosyl transferase family 25